MKPELFRIDLLKWFDLFRLSVVWQPHYRKCCNTGEAWMLHLSTSFNLINRSTTTEWIYCTVRLNSYGVCSASLSRIKWRRRLKKTKSRHTDLHEPLGVFHLSLLYTWSVKLWKGLISSGMRGAGGDGKYASPRRERLTAMKVRRDQMFRFQCRTVKWSVKCRNKNTTFLMESCFPQESSQTFAFLHKSEFRSQMKIR